MNVRSLYPCIHRVGNLYHLVKLSKFAFFYGHHNHVSFTVLNTSLLLFFRNLLLPSSTSSMVRMQLA